MWGNWAGNQNCNPRHYNEPKTLDELRNCIQDAASHGYRVKAVGGGYSRSNIACTDGLQLNLKNLNRIISIDVKKKLVHVESGITIQELNERLACYDLALSNQAAIANLTLGGALSTAVHGTGHTGTLSSFIRMIELITADGTIHALSSASDSDAFAAATVSLGALGVIYSVKLQCESLFHLKLNRKFIQINDLMCCFKEYNNRNDFFQFLWNVESGTAEVMCWNRCGQENAYDSLSNQPQVCYHALTWFAIDDNNKDLASEIAIPVDNLPIIVPKVEKLLKKHKQQGAEIADICVRFVEADENAYLSPAAERSVAYISMSTPVEDRYIAFYKKFEDLVYQNQGRPHWGKLIFLNHEKAFSLYGTNLLKFIDVKCRLDPQGIFSNEFVDQILIDLRSKEYLVNPRSLTW